MRIKKFNFQDITKPKEGLVIYKDRYWVCKEGNPEQALFFGNTAQCNKNIDVVKYILESKTYREIDDLQIVFVPLAYIPNIYID